MEPTSPTDDDAAARVRRDPGVPGSELVDDARRTLLGAHGNWTLVFLRGLLAIVFALLAFLWPAATMASLVLLFAAYMLVDGVFAIASGVHAARAHERWGWFALEGIADLIAAVVAFLWPSITILAFVFVAAAWAVISGGLMLVAAFRLGAQRGRAWLIAAGVVSLAWGLLLIVAPVAGAIVMLWWLGAYALAFGVSMIAAAWRLRRELGGPRPIPPGDLHHTV